MKKLLNNLSLLVKDIPLWIFMPLIILLMYYGPTELTRLIYRCAWDNTIVDDSGCPHYVFVIEIVWMWSFMAMGLLLVFLRARNVTTKDDLRSDK